MQSLKALNQGMENFFRSGGEQGLARTDLRSKGKSEENGLHIKWEELKGDQAHKFCCILL